MTYRQLFILGNRLLGEALRSATIRQGELAPPLSYMFFCKHCGEVYARAPVYLPASGKATTPWQSIRAMCSSCTPKQQFYSEFPGSLWLSWDAPYLAALPPSVLAWEFSCAAQSYDRFQGYAS